MKKITIGILLFAIFGFTTGTYADEEKTLHPSPQTDWKKPVYFFETVYLKFELPDSTDIGDIKNFELNLDIDKSPYCVLHVKPHYGSTDEIEIRYSGSHTIYLNDFKRKNLYYFYDRWTNSISFTMQIFSNDPMPGSYSQLSDAALTVYYR